MFEFALNPVALSIGPIDVRWYGIFYAVAFLFVYFYIRSRIRSGKFVMHEEDLETLLILLVIAMVLGARTAEVLIYNPGHYLTNLWKIFAVWEGGLSFHGALVGMLLATYFFAKKKKYNFLSLCDEFVVPISLGLALGRLGNFINGELVGRITAVPWAFYFPGYSGYRHPSQLYELVKNLLIFSVLYNLRDKLFVPGTRIALFLVLYGVLRFVVEFFRQPTVMVGPLTAGQVLSIPLVLIGCWFLWARSRRSHLNRAQ